MTSHKHLKQLVRARMAKTGERYAAARRQILVQPAPTTKTPESVHRPGNVPAATALRVLLNQAGLPVSEAQAFVLAGGIGAGVFAFLYEKEDFASLFIAGRHLWHDDCKYLSLAGKRLGLTRVIKEATGGKAGEEQLQEALEGGRAVIAWVDAAGLPHRAMPLKWAGGGYHVVTIYGIHDGQVLIGDLTDEPVSLTLKELAAARARIKKFKHRLLWFEPAKGKPDLRQATQDSFVATREALTSCKMKNYRLDAFGDLANRMHGGKGKESWEVMFPPGGRLWTALTSLYDFIEHYGTGGGLCRPLFAVGLAEAGRSALAEQYAELGEEWSALADAALPDEVPACRETKELLARKAELTHSAGEVAEIRRCWEELDRLSASAGKRFPMTDRQATDLRLQLQRRLRQLHAAEVAALEELPVK